VIGALVEGRRSLDVVVFDMSLSLEVLLKTFLLEKMGDIIYGWRGIDVLLLHPQDGE